MDEILQLTLNYLRMVWRRRWIALLIALSVCLVGWTHVFLLPNVYEANSRVYLDTRTTLRPLLKGLAVDVGSREHAAQLMRRTLLIRPNLETVARRNDMDLNAKTPEDLEQILNGLRRAIRLRGTSRDNIYNISYASEDPKLAAGVVEALLNIFVEGTLGESREDSTSTAEFLDRQIKEYERKLVAGELRMKEFKQKNVGIMPGAERSYVSRRQALTERIRQAEIDLRETEQRRDALSEKLADLRRTALDPESRGGSVVKTKMSPLDERIHRLETQLDQLLLQFTEQHPDVVRMRTVLAALKQEKSTQLTDGSSAEAILAQNPAYQELKVVLSEVEGEVAALKARVQEFERREDELTGLIDASLNVEAEFARLNRDYGLIRKRHQELLSRRESLRMAEDVNQTTDQIQFRVLEPPREPVIPRGPNRKRLEFVVLFLGLGMGAAATILIEFIRPAVYSREDLATLSDAPVIAVLSRNWTSQLALKRKLEVLTFGIGCLFLAALFAAMLSAEPYRETILSRLNDLTGVDIVEFAKRIR